MNGMPMPATNATPMSGMTMAPALFVAMMAAMMLPSAVPAIVRRAWDGTGVLAAPLFAGSYLGVWAFVGLVLGLAYRPPGAAVSTALLIGAGVYELTPFKRECRRRCRGRVRSGARFGVLCLGSSIGLMLVLVAVNVMSVVLMIRDRGRRPRAEASSAAPRARLLRGGRDRRPGHRHRRHMKSPKRRRV